MIQKTFSRCGARGSVAAAIVCLSLMPASAAPPRAGTLPILLRMRYKLGDATRYRMTMQMQTTITVPNNRPMTTNMGVTLDQEQKVTRLLPNGGGAVTGVTSNLKSSKNGGPMLQSAPVAPVTVSCDALGHVTRLKGIGAASPGAGFLSSAFSSGGISGIGLYLPTKPVKPGDTWRGHISIPGVTTNALVRSTFVRMENVGPLLTARIRVVMRMPIKLMTDVSGRPVNARAAVMNAVGACKIAVDYNFSPSLGKMVQTAGGGDFALTMKSTRQGAAPAMQNIRMAMRMRIATNMMQ